MTMRAGKFVLCAAVLAAAMPAAASAEELSEKAVRSFMDYAWSLTPQQYSKSDGTTIQIDKTKKDAVLLPVDVAREVIMAGRLSAHAQVCNLREDQIANHRALMRREDARGKWTPQQMVYISQLHLTTVMLLTGKIKLVEKQGDKQVVIEEGKSNVQTCSPEQAQKVKQMIAEYVSKGPPISTVMALPGAEGAGDGTAPAAAAGPATATPAAEEKK